MATGDLPPINNPAGYVAQHATAYADDLGRAISVTAALPLPVELRPATASSQPLAATSATTTTAGPFTPQLGRAINLTLTGTWAGSVQVLRSIDGGTTKLPLTVAGQPWASFTANCNEPVWEPTEAGATFYLAITLTSGTVGYRVSQ